MRAVTTERQRRFFVRLRAGEELLEALEVLAQRERLQAAWIRGVGALERAALEHVVLDEPCEVVALSGSLSWDGDEPRPRLRVALAPLSDGARLIGGVLLRAVATDVELLVESFDDVPIDLVEVAPRPPRIRATAPRVEPPPDAGDDLAEEDDEDEAESSASPGVSWADVARASAHAEPAPPPPPPRGAAAPRAAPHEPPPRPEATVEHRGPAPDKGDFVQHVQFGLCKVERTDGRGSIVIKLPSGVRKKLRLDFMDVGRPRRDEGRRVFPVRPRSR